MSKWTCRTCGGGFPEPIEFQGNPVCPWCSAEIVKFSASDYQKKQILNNEY